MRAMKLFKEHQVLLMRRESRVVVGRKAINLWLLVAVLLATFIAIAFSTGSMAYLKEKMNDPFTNWVSINRGPFQAEKMTVLKTELQDSSIQNQYHFVDVKSEIEASIDLLSPDNKSHFFKILHYEDLSSDLIAKVLDKDNVVNDLSINPDSIDQYSMGLIITAHALELLGYDINNAPSFLHHPVKASDAGDLGFSLIDDKYVSIPLPLLAVVKRLPLNKPLIASNYLFFQSNDDALEAPFNMDYDDDYVRKLRFFVPQGVSFTPADILDCVPDSLQDCYWVSDAEERIQVRLRNWKDGLVVTVDVGLGDTPLDVICSVENSILNHYKQQGVVRVYDYRESRNNDFVVDDAISVHFASLDSIRPFQRFVEDVSDLQIEMTQVNNRENFKAVSNMATILTVALLLFAIVSIIIFIVNMMQSYFQKVKRNLGTFKAFGISIHELIRVYVAIIVGIVVAALVIALAVTWTMEELLQLFDVVMEDGSKFLVLWKDKTFFAIAVILVSTVVSVLVVMRRLLRQTPGNLIYDR